MSAPLALALTLMLGKTPAPAPSVAYRSQELGFLAQFPGAPAIAHAAQHTALGEIPTVTLGVDLQGAKDSFVVAVTSYPPELMPHLVPASVLSDSEAASLRNAAATLVQDSEVSLSGPASLAGPFPGRDFTATVKGAQLHARLYLVKEKLYMLLTVAEAGHEAAAQAFLDSFQLVAPKQ